jgi:CRISP-associated protein Cas1
MTLNEITGSDGILRDEWAERGDYWLKKINPIPQYKARKRRILHKPLVLSGHGIRLNIDRGTLLIKCGFTHYPQPREEYRFFPRDRQLPSRIVILDGDGSITLDALEWMSVQDVPLVQIDWQGHLSGVGNSNFSADEKKVRLQYFLRENGEGFKFSCQLILQKIDNCYHTIKSVSGNSAEAQPILQKIKAQAVFLRERPPTTISALLSAEGVAAMYYFQYWYSLSMKWKGLGRRPIPPEWLRVGSRTSKYDHNQFATHPVNAILNYAYAVLKSQVGMRLIANGLDPTIGYLHQATGSRSALIYDFMEPLRPYIDGKVLDMVIRQIFSPEDFILNKEGVCRLHPQLARFIVKMVEDIPAIDSITAENIRLLFGKIKSL